MRDLSPYEALSVRPCRSRLSNVRSRPTSRTFLRFLRLHVEKLFVIEPLSHLMRCRFRDAEVNLITHSWESPDVARETIWAVQTNGETRSERVKKFTAAVEIVPKSLTKSFSDCRSRTIGRSLLASSPA